MPMSGGTHLVVLAVTLATIRHTLCQSPTSSTICGQISFRETMPPARCDVVCRSNLSASVQCPSLDELCPSSQNACSLAVPTAPTPTTLYPNKCLLGTHNCHVNANCRDVAQQAAFTCTCKSGYAGDGTHCTDIDECATPASRCPGVASVCRNSPGTYKCYSKGGGICNGKRCTPGSSCFGNLVNVLCLCDKGYGARLDTSGVITHCDNINECLSPITPPRCRANSICDDIIGSYTCPCMAGYREGTSKTCVDVNECVESHRCASEAVCRNTFGNYTCSCTSGYTGDGMTCTDVDECRRDTSHTCRNHSTCRNTKGSYECECLPGYTGPAETCTDVDECMTSLHGCHSNASCTNSPGNYSCQCGVGYTGDVRVCSNVDECSTMTEPECHRDAVCVDTVGSFACVCKANFHGTGKDCKAVPVAESNSYDVAFAVMTSILLTLSAVSAILFLYRRRQRGKYAMRSAADEGTAMVMNTTAAATTTTLGDAPDADVIVDPQPETIEYLDVDRDDRHGAVENDYGFGDGEEAQQQGACDQEYVVMKKSHSFVNTTRPAPYENVQLKSPEVSTATEYWNVARGDGEVSDVAVAPPPEADDVASYLDGIEKPGRASIRRTQSFDNPYLNHRVHASAGENKGGGGARPFLVRLPSLDPAADERPFKVPIRPTPRGAGDVASSGVPSAGHYVVDGVRGAVASARVATVGRSASSRLPTSNADVSRATRSGQNANTARDELTRNLAYSPSPTSSRVNGNSTSEEIQVAFPLGELLPSKDKPSTFSWDARGDTKKRMEIISDSSPRGSVRELVMLKKRD